MADPTAAELRKELLDLFARIDDGPLTLETGLRASANIRGALDALQHELVGLARDEGASWSQIASALGVTTQAAHQRLANVSPLRASAPNAPVTRAATKTKENSPVARCIGGSNVVVENHHILRDKTIKRGSGCH